ncbi:PAS domain-containing sensor histidine kinase [Pseudomonas sp. ZM23]|uniref:histidine kinase n=1 Tax=Pseudomonas triclosanedens TaxID=2961893 RepID=A0ABY7A301_9PSED|nr:ATP-binding protein [Pseudomonas triclosanedens]MCP8464710.1 PAS domain-containing sensor histidine kinase [Pseudomonas triclosanedens]MCP8470577.1 PAS domain-containing sensor histidine kinase [Pseudomonas triclosanedens]MCP8476383.1 PAS domain-containing sensor histidine kinase [Pseudomonas triclosanedens]WAI51391.1 ATP-binding protein [Pseudomonas triclosanedens]
MSYVEFVGTADTTAGAIALAFLLAGGLFFCAWHALRWRWLLWFALAYGLGATAFGLRGALQVDDSAAPILQVAWVTAALTLVTMGIAGATGASNTLRSWTLGLSIFAAVLEIDLWAIDHLSVFAALHISAVYFIGFGLLTMVAMRRDWQAGYIVVLAALGMHLGGIAIIYLGWIEPITAQNLGTLPVLIIGLAMLCTQLLKLHRQELAHVIQLCEAKAQLQALNQSLEGQVAERTAQLQNYKQFLDDTVQALPDATLVCDALSNVLLANRAAAEYFGVSAPSDLSGKRASSLLKRLRTLDGEAVFSDSGLGVFAHEQGSIECGDGERSLMLRMTRVHDTDSTTLGNEYVVICTDITGLRQAQAERDEALRFITHDMRAPQASTLTLIELLRVSPGAVEPEEFTRRIESNARRTLQLAESFLLMSKVQEGELQLSPCHLDAVLYEAIDGAWSTAKASQIDIRIDQPDEGEVLADTVLLQRALANLLDNAIKVSPRGAEIVCQITHTADLWRIDVIDQGPGLDPLQVQALHKPFSHSPFGSRHKGFGLGLAFVSKVAQRHGGKLVVDSTLGHGARFSLLLPLKAPQNSLADHT